MFFFLLLIRPYLSIRLLIVSYRIYWSLFTCHSDLVCVCVLFRSDLVRVLLGSTVSIGPSHYRVVRYLLFPSLRVILLLLRPPTDTATPTPLSFVIVESILNLIRTHLSRRPTLLLHVSSLFNRSVLLLQ